MLTARSSHQGFVKAFNQFLRPHGITKPYPVINMNLCEDWRGLTHDESFAIGGHFPILQFF